MKPRNHGPQSPPPRRPAPRGWPSRARPDPPPAEEPPPPTRGEKAKRKLKKLVVWLAVIGLFFLLISLFQDELVALLRKSPFLWSVYSHVAEQVEGRTLLGLVYGGFIGALFFVIVPLEPLFFYYLSLDYSAAWVIVLMLVSSVLGLFVNYLIGAAVGGTLLTRFARERFEKVKRSMERWGGGLVFLSNVVLFLPVQVLSLVIGATRFGARRFLLWTFAGRTVYLVMLYYAADFFSNHLVPTP